MSNPLYEINYKNAKIYLYYYDIHFMYNDPKAFVICKVEDIILDLQNEIFKYKFNSNTDIFCKNENNKIRNLEEFLMSHISFLENLKEMSSEEIFGKILFESYKYEYFESSDGKKLTIKFKYK